MKITTKIRNKLKEKELTQNQLARLVDYCHGAFGSMVRGESVFPDPLVDKICKVLEMPKSEFAACILADKYSKEIIELAVKEAENKQDKEILVLTQNIDRILEKKNISRTALSKLVKYDQSGLNRMIVGKNSMSKKVISRIAVIFELSEDVIRSWILADKYSIEVLKLALVQ